MPVKTRFKARNWMVEERDFILPGGMKKHKAYVRDIPTIVSVLPIMNDGRILLIKEYRPLVGKYIYSIVFGKANPGEVLAQAVKRELLEEAGYTAKSLRLLFKFYVSPGMIKQAPVGLYLATGLTRAKANRDVDEVIKIVPMSVAKALKLIRDGMMVDPPTIAAVLFYATFIDGKSF
jgi:ADP-ribose pyrophosphatase